MATKKKATKKTKAKKMTLAEKEQLLDEVERLYLMGKTKPYHMQTHLGVPDYRTAEGYIKTIRQRIARRYKDIDREAYYYDQLKKNDIALDEALDNMLTTKAPTQRSGAIKAYILVAKARADLLGLEPPKEVNVSTGDGDDLLALLSKLPNERARAIIKELREASKAENDGD